MSERRKSPKAVSASTLHGSRVRFGKAVEDAPNPILHDALVRRIGMDGWPDYMQSDGPIYEDRVISHLQAAVQCHRGELMWLFTNFGFFSVVQKPAEADLTVRSRVQRESSGCVPSRSR